MLSVADFRESIESAYTELRRAVIDKGLVMREVPALFEYQQFVDIHIALRTQVADFLLDSQDTSERLCTHLFACCPTARESAPVDTEVPVEDDYKTEFCHRCWLAVHLFDCLSVADLRMQMVCVTGDWPVSLELLPGLESYRPICDSCWLRKREASKWESPYKEQPNFAWFMSSVLPLNDPEKALQGEQWLNKLNQPGDDWIKARR